MPRTTRSTRGSIAGTRVPPFPYAVPLAGTKSSNVIGLRLAQKGTVRSDPVSGEDGEQTGSRNIGDQGQIPEVQMTDVQLTASDVGISLLPSHESNTSSLDSGGQCSQRLPIVGPKRKARIGTLLGREKRSPYAVLWEPAHQQFLAALQAPYDITDAESLPNVETHAYATTLRGSRQTGNFETDFKARAIRRGRHRALLQTALRTLAKNEEQYYRGGWLGPLIEPASQPCGDQQRTSLLSGDSESSDQDPFYFTRRYLQFRTQQRLLEQLVIANGPSKDDSEDWDLVGKHVFAKPFASVSITSERLVKPVKFLSSVLLSFTGGESLAQLTTLPFDIPPELLQPWKQRALLIRAIQAGAQAYVRPKRPAITLLDPDELRTLQEMSQKHIMEASPGTICLFGQQFGQLYRKLMQQTESMNETLEARSTLVQKARRGIETLRRTIHASFPGLGKQYLSLVELAAPLHAGRGTLTPETAAMLIQSRIAEECHRSARGATTDHRQLWSFSASLPTEIRRKRWFNLEKRPSQSSAGSVRGGIDEDGSRGSSRSGTGSGSRPGQLSDPMDIVVSDPMSLDHKSQESQPEPMFTEAPPSVSVPQAGTGELMPSEILRFQWERDVYRGWRSPKELSIESL